MMHVVKSSKPSLEKDIVQLIYCSRAHKLGHQFSCDCIVEDILDRSTSRNSLREVTGTLLTDKKFFAQIIEGSPSAINQLYKSILYDERHYRVMLLQHTVTNIRLFPQWPMALVEVDDMSYVGRLSVQSTPEDLRKTCLSILKSLRPVFCGR